ncbi:MAG TPA: type II TA system antitoxin MqsA family protein [Candidatus Sulfotelmatobacter sp.]
MRSRKSNCSHGEMVEQIVELAGERNCESFLVSVPGLVCSKCGFVTISNKQSGTFTQAVSDAYRNAHNLLTGDELRVLRNQRGMSQVEFAEYLGVGPASIKRWESGQVQDKAMDELIRLKTDPAIALRNAHELNRDCRFIESGEAVQIYHPRAKITLDTSGLDESEVFVEVGQAMAA